MESIKFAPYVLMTHDTRCERFAVPALLSQRFYESETTQPVRPML